MILPLELAESVSASSFLAHETTVKLRRDIRITCKIFFILSSKSKEFISNLKVTYSYYGIRNSEQIIQSYWICTRDYRFNPLYFQTVDLFLPYVNNYILLV